jgi:hypothetical protein
MFRQMAAAAVCVAALSGPAIAADAKDPLVRARALYNEGQFDAAIVAADEARRNPLRASSADLIAARAYLERYRAGQAETDLITARERLRRISPQQFTDNERLEFVVGLGQALYFDDASGAAALVFGSVLEGATELPAASREHIVDWWATALDRDARPRPDIDRQGIYQRIRDRMSAELSLNPGNAAALYWAAAAARSQGDLQAAWDAAQAGWAWAPLAEERAEKLRQDLDELVTRAIIPERARRIGQPVETLTAEWDAFKEKWRP